MILRLLKVWKAQDGVEYAKGKTISVEDTEEGTQLAKTLVFDGVAEKASGKVVSPTAGEDEIQAAIEKAVDKVVKEDSFVNKVGHSIKVHDRSDDDPTHGFLPGNSKSLKDLSPEEIKVAAGRFAASVYQAGEGMRNASETLRKSIERSAKVIDDGIASGVIGKTAGDGLSVAVNSEAGVLAPPAVSMALLDRKLAASPIRQYATTLPMTGQAVKLPRVKNYDHSSNLVFGGVLAYWKSEEAELTASKPVHEEIRLELHKLSALGYVSEEAMRWAAIDLGAYTLDKLGQAIGWAETKAFIRGTGVGQPLGLLNAPGKIAVTEGATQTTTVDCVTPANVDEMFQRLYVEDASKCVFLYNRLELLGFLRAMYRTTTGGTLITAAPMLTGNPLGMDARLDGVPLIDTEHCSAKAVEGAMMLTDMSQYIVASDSAGAQAAVSMHLKFDYAQQAFRVLSFVDGQPANTTYFTRAQGAVTASSIVVLPTMT